MYHLTIVSGSQYILLGVCNENQTKCIRYLYIIADCTRAGRTTRGDPLAWPQDTLLC